MFSLRQILRCGMRLTLTTEPINLHRISLIGKQKSDVNFCGRIFLCTKANLCDSPQEEKEENVNKQILGKLEKKIKVMFTCKKCNYRTGKIISKLAYEKGVVIIRCDGCKNNHLISDNLGWFEQLKGKANIEKLMAAKGETIRKVQNDVDGYIEILEKAELDLIQHNKNWEQHVTEQNQIRNRYEKDGSSEET